MPKEKVGFRRVDGHAGYCWVGLSTTCAEVAEMQQITGAPVPDALSATPLECRSPGHVRYEYTDWLYEQDPDCLYPEDAEQLRQLQRDNAPKF